MNTLIKKLLAGSILLLAATQNLQAATTIYSIRVDGLPCTYFAYGIEKKLNQLDGVRFIDMDLDKGIVTVETHDVKLNDRQLEKLFKDSGFTYRSKTETEKGQ